MNQNDRLAWIALHLLPGIGSVLSHKLVSAFGSPQAVFDQTQQVLSAQQRISSPLARTIAAADWQSIALRELDTCGKQGVALCTPEDAEYPALLKAAPYPPACLYYRGRLASADDRALAVVGSRKASAYGLSAARKLAGELARNGVTIVSGLALGIDTAAHLAALENQARTIAVVAHGLDRVYPPRNHKLFNTIAEKGAVVSEFRLGTPSYAGHFPQRNRLISGLAQGVLVVEAGETSGSLITARWAGEQNREVFAVPGAYHAALSQGTHALIRDGATLVTCAKDIFAELPGLGRGSVRHRRESSGAALTGEALEIFRALHPGGMHVDQIALAVRKPVQKIMLDLLRLEMKGQVKSDPGQIYHWIGDSVN